MRRSQVSALVALLVLGPAVGCVPTDAAGPKVTIYYEGEYQFEIFDLQGTRVLIDVGNQRLLTMPPTEDDVLLTTFRGCPSSFNGRFAESFPGQQLETGEMALPDVTIKGIASSNVESSQPGEGDNRIYVVEMAGLRIAHFGHIGQNELTQDQLDALGDIDIAITQLANSYSRMDIENKKGFHLMDQVRPRLIIPTRSDMKTVEHAVARWESHYADSPVNIARSDLLDETRFLIMGDGTNSSIGLAYKGIHNLPDW